MSEQENKSVHAQEGPPALVVELETRFGRLCGKVPLPPGPMTLAELAWNALFLDERLIGLAVASEERLGRLVSCSKGCGACCRQAVPVSLPEAWILRDTVAVLPVDRRKTVLERFAAAKERLIGEGFAERSVSPGATAQQVQRLGLDYFHLQLSCPFLDDESCSIYRYRPSSCREYLVSSPPPLCSDPGAKALRPVPQATSMTDALARVCAAVTGSEPKVMPLVAALDWAEEQGAERRESHDPVMLITLLVQCLR